MEAVIERDLEQEGKASPEVLTAIRQGFTDAVWRALQAEGRGTPDSLALALARACREAQEEVVTWCAGSAPVTPALDAQGPDRAMLLEEADALIAEALK